MECPEYLHGIMQETVNMENMAASERLNPSFLYKPSLSLDGNQWCALLGSNLQHGVCGFGNTPREAMAAFDKAWDTPARAVLPVVAQKTENVSHKTEGAGLTRRD
ncbi:hypothetical protein KAR91_30525 [Candidatus Pacearchaeota archaeon]|nr:hypothetical protein [Candidatus Pacearchaeota archaeon]